MSTLYRLAWATDLHLDHADAREVGRVAHHLTWVRDSPEAVAMAIAGDTAQAATLADALTSLERHSRPSKLPIYFVLGNHDSYGSSVEHTERVAAGVSKLNSRLVYLPEAGVVPLSTDTAIVGVDGWYDGQDAEASSFRLSDHSLVSELSRHAGKVPLDRPLDRRQRDAVGWECNRLAERSAGLAKTLLDAAFGQYHNVVLVTHVPPFELASMYLGRPSSSEARTYFTNRILGNELIKTMDIWWNKHLTVLCGHTHFEARFQARPNLEVRCGHADYGFPDLQPPLWIP